MTTNIETLRADYVTLRNHARTMGLHFEADVEAVMHGEERTPQQFVKAALQVVTCDAYARNSFDVAQKYMEGVRSRLVSLQN